MENLAYINQNLINLFGIDSVTGKATWRIVWSEDQFEKRLMYYTNTGFQLINPEVREVPKYRQWIKEKYVIERLTIVPLVNQDELPVEHTSYEPVWVFEDAHGNPLPPKIEAAKFIIDNIYAHMGKSTQTKYKDPDSDPKEALANKEKRVEQLHNELFGNESEVGDALAYREGVGYRKGQFES